MLNYGFEGWFKFFVGVVLLMIGIAYLYRPSWILRINAWGRHFMFNDSFVLHYRRRWGLLFFFVACLFFYSAFRNLAPQDDSDYVPRPALRETSHP